MNNKRSIIAGIGCLDRIVTLRIQRKLKEYGLGRGQYYFLNELLFVGDGITHTELSEKLSVDKAATTRAVHKPEQSGPGHRGSPSERPTKSNHLYDGKGERAERRVS